MTRFNSASDTMKLLGISAQKLYYWRKTGKISFTKVEI
jgi:predicted site-specific integrase-resolvase